MSTADAFSEYEEDYRAESAAIKRKINEIHASSPSEQKPLIQQAEVFLRNMSLTLQKMEQELRHMPYSAKARAQTLLNDYRRTQKESSNELQALKSVPVCNGRSYAGSRSVSRG